MDKFRKFCEKPLLIISSIMTAIFVIALVVLACIPNGKVYDFRYEIEDANFVYEVTLDKKYKVTHKYYVDGYAYNVGDVSKHEFEYEVINGKLYLLDGVTTERQEIGEINSKKLILKENVLGEDGGTVLYCEINRTLSTFFIMGTTLGFILLATSIILRFAHNHYDRQNLLNNEEKQVEQSAETEQ